MRKQLISICTTIILAFSIYGCAKTSEDALATETENVGPQDTEAEREEASDEGALDKTANGGDHEQSEDEADPMSDTAEQDMFTYIIDDNSAVITGLQEEYENSLQENMPIHGEIEIPDTLGGCPVVEIGDHAFENIKLKSVKIPKTVEVIGNSAFRNTDIENVNLSECYNLKEVKANAFENCNLHDQNYYAWFMEKIGERAFAGNKLLTRVNFWSGDAIIEKNAFDGCGDEMLFLWNGAEKKPVRK